MVTVISEKGITENADIDDLHLYGLYNTAVYKVEITIHQNKNPAMSDKALLSGLTNWLQSNLEKTNNNLKDKHGYQSGYSFVVSYSEIDKINLGSEQ